MSDEPTKNAGSDETPKDPSRPPPDKDWVKTKKGTYSREPDGGGARRPPGETRDGG